MVSPRVVLHRYTIILSNIRYLRKLIVKKEFADLANLNWLMIPQLITYFILEPQISYVALNSYSYN